MEKRQRIAEYEKRYMADYGFEAIMVAARQRLILELLGRFRPRTVLEIGCGVDMLGAQVTKECLPVEQWIIVEPAERFFNAAQSLKMGATRVDVIRGFLEDSIDAIRARCARAPDFIVCSGLLNEVEQPEGILRAARGLLGASGIVHANVPNAFSLHRRLARAMGIIETENQLTERNRKLAQYHVFDLDGLADLAAGAGFRVIEKGGYFLKPFTHAQMETIAGVLSDAMLDGLWRLGRELPELASEIYVNLEAA
jgi:2-polyprenyl-3-methyl-5-hydroxy-6-metoxy-1,4-benzoquinol methylase